MATSTSATSGSGYYSPSAMNSSTLNRLTGLASGLDTESMVKSLMAAESARYNKLSQQKQLMDWTGDANREVNNLLKDFRDKYLTAMSNGTSMLNSNSILAYKVTADSTASVSITTDATAVSGSHVINSITSLAAGANAASASRISSGDISANSMLSDLGLSNPLQMGEDGTLSFAINGETFTFYANNTLRDVINTVNRDPNANVTMSYSSLTGKISVASKTLGSASTMVIKNISGNAFSDENAAFGIAQGTFTNGKNAQLKIDGVDVVKNSNTFAIDGITYNLKGTTSTQNNFTVDQDIDGAVDKIKGFIDDYNALIDKLQTKLDEKRDTDYQPLTDDQKSQMSESQITQWEDKTKTGLLHNDSNITRLLSDMRRAFFDNVSAAGLNASSIGLSTISYQTQGEINVDVDKLRKALQNNPQQVQQVLTNLSYDPVASRKYKDSGTIARLYNSVSSYLDDYSGYRTDVLNDQYKTLNSSISSEKTRLKDKESHYWDEFNQMEQAMAQMNSQSSWLSAQFSNGSNG